MTAWSEVEAMALELPGVEASVSYGEPSLKVGRSLLTRWRKNDDSIVLLDVDPFERERLLAETPEVFFLEPHYEPHAIVLARLARIEAETVRMYLERRWKNVASKRLRKQWEESIGRS
jgi:hypothetical protein